MPEERLVPGWSPKRWSLHGVASKVRDATGSDERRFRLEYQSPRRDRSDRPARGLHGSVMAQCLDRVQVGGLARRVDAEDQSHAQ